MPTKVRTNSEEVILALGKFSSKELRLLAQETTNELVETTPRNTGWAANSWVPQVGIPYTELPGNPDNPFAGATVRATNLARITSNYELGDGNIFVSSSIPYMNRLNEGHSRKAPAGFIQMAVINATARVR